MLKTVNLFTISLSQVFKILRNQNLKLGWKTISDVVIVANRWKFIGEKLIFIIVRTLVLSFIFYLYSSKTDTKTQISELEI